MHEGRPRDCAVTAHAFRCVYRSCRQVSRKRGVRYKCCLALALPRTCTTSGHIRRTPAGAPWKRPRSAQRMMRLSDLAPSSFPARRRASGFSSRSSTTPRMPSMRDERVQTVLHPGRAIAAANRCPTSQVPHLQQETWARGHMDAGARHRRLLQLMAEQHPHRTNGLHPPVPDIGCLRPCQRAENSHPPAAATLRNTAALWVD